MRLSKEQLEHLIAQSTDMVVATDSKGIVAYYNDGAKRGLGYSDAEILGEFVGRLYPSLEEAKRVMAAMRDPHYCAPGKVETFQTTFVTKDGVQIPVAISGAIILDDAGNEAGTIGFAKDLREILRKDQLATLGEVAIGLSHEINNPLAVILNQVELLNRDVDRLAGDQDSSIESERLDAIRREIARIAEILERLGEMAADEHYETVEYIGPAKMIDLRRKTKSSSTTRQRLSGMRILVADDDLGICRSMDEILSEEGAIVETASDGAEALQKVKTTPFDLLLSDVVMPNMDGYELYIAVHELYPELPVLMMTAFHYDKDHIIKRGRIQGLQGVVFKKPVDPERLVQVICETSRSNH